MTYEEQLNQIELNWTDSFNAYNTSYHIWKDGMNDLNKEAKENNGIPKYETEMKVDELGKEVLRLSIIFNVFRDERKSFFEYIRKNNIHPLSNDWYIECQWIL